MPAEARWPTSASGVVASWRQDANKLATQETTLETQHLQDPRLALLGLPVKLSRSLIWEQHSLECCRESDKRWAS